MYTLLFSLEAKKDQKKAARSQYSKKIQSLLEIIKLDPYCDNPSYEKLIGLDHVYSRRINLQHRLVYQVDENSKRIKIIKMWTHYGDN